MPCSEQALPARQHREVPHEVMFSFIRKKWQEHAEDPSYSEAHPEILKDMLHVKTMLATVADLQTVG